MIQNLRIRQYNFIVLLFCCVLFQTQMTAQTASDVRNAFNPFFNGNNFSISNLQQQTTPGNGKKFTADATLLGVSGVILTVDASGDGAITALEASFSNLENRSLESLLKAIGGEALLAEAQTPVTSAILGAISLPISSIIIVPTDKKLKVSSGALAGDSAFEVSKNEDDKWIFSLNYTPDFGFAAISSELAVIDSINFIESYTISISNDTKDKPAGAPSKVALGIQAKCSSSTFDTLFKKLFPDNSPYFEPELVLTGTIESDFSFDFAADMQLDLDMGNRYKLEKVGLLFSYTKGARSPKIGFDGSMIVPADDTYLRFTLGLASEPAALTIEGSFELESINDDSELTEWVEPYGMPYITFTSIKGNVAASGSTLIDNLGFGLDLKIGSPPKNPKQDSRIPGRIDVQLDVDPAQNEYHSELENFNFLGLIKAIDEHVNIPNEVADFLDTGLEKSSFHFVPKDGYLKIKGDATFLSVLKGKVDIEISDAGASFGGQMDKVSFKPDEIEILSITSATNSNEGPNFLIQLNVDDPQVNFDGAMSVFGLEVASQEMYIDKNGINVSATIDFAGLGGGTVRINGANFANDQKLDFYCQIQPDILGNLKKELVDAVRSKAGDVAGEIVDFVIPQFGITNMELATNLDGVKPTIDAIVDFEAGLFGEVKTFHIEVPLEADFGSPKNLAASIAKIMGEIGLTLISEFSNLAVIVFEAAVKLLSDVASAIGKAFNVIGEEIASWFKDRTFENVNNGTEPEWVRPSFNQYQITSSLVNNGADNDDKFYGTSVAATFKSGGDYNNFLSLVNFSLSPGQTYLRPGANRAIISYDEGERIIVNGTKPFPGVKTFYVKKDVDFDVMFYNEFYEQINGWADSEYSSITVLKDVNKKAIATGRKNVGNGLWTVIYKIEQLPEVPKEKVLRTIRVRDSIGFMVYLKKGADIASYGEAAIDEAITSKNNDALITLLKLKISSPIDYPVNATEANLTRACDFWNRSTVTLVLGLLDKNTLPKANHINAAFKDKAFGLVGEMIEKGGMPDAESLSYALQYKKYRLAEAFIKDYNLKPSEQDLDLAIYNQDKLALDIILALVNPTEAHFLQTARASKTAIFKQLYAKNPDVIKTTKPAEIAIDNGNTAILKMCLNKTVTPDMVLEYAVNSKHKPSIELCLKQGANPKNGVITAIANNDVESLNLITKNVQVNLKEPEYFFTAVDFSKRGSHAKIVELLLKNGNSPNEYRDSITGNSLLHIVSKRRRKNKKRDRFQLGLFNGKPFYFPDIFKKRRDYKIMELLINANADLTVTNNKGWTPLHMGSNRARNNKSLKLVALMVEKGADVNACTHKNKTVYKIADGRKTRKFLKSQGARKKGCD